MTTEAIVESGMKFGPYPAGECFYIEKSKCYSRVKNDGVKMAEFLLLRQQKVGPTVWIVEAKSSCPRKLDSCIDEISAKLTNALVLNIAACLGRHPETHNDFPISFKALTLQTTDFRFVLVVKGVPDYHLPVLQDALGKALRPTIKTWAIASSTPVIVLNEAKAKVHGIISP